MKVLKFGGSSLATPAAIRAVGAIVLDARRHEPVLVVVSAFRGVTDQLLDCARLAERGEAGYLRAFDQIARRHRAAVTALVLRGRAGLRKQVDTQLDELKSTLQGIYLLRHCPPRALDMTASFGERLSALILAAYLKRFHPSELADARDFVRTDDQFTHASVNFAVTNREIRKRFAPLLRKRRAPIPVITGFIGATDDGQTTTIGRNGSDYSAAIVGAAVGANTTVLALDVAWELQAQSRSLADAPSTPPQRVAT